MSKKVLMLTAVVLVFSACEVEASIIYSNWVGGSEGNWDNANNWNPAIVPTNNATNTFVVTIDAGPSEVREVRVYLRFATTINQLHCRGRGEVRLDGWKSLARLSRLNVSGLTNYGGLRIEKIKLAGNITNLGDLEIDEVELLIGNVMNYGYLELAETEVIGNVTNYDGAKLEFEDPGAEINGNLYNRAGGTIEVESLAEIKQGNINNAGLIFIYSAGAMWYENKLRNSGQIKLTGGSLLYWEEENGQGVLHNNSPGVIMGFGVVEANQLIQNKGTICASTGPLLLHSNNSVTNTGMLKNDVGATLHIETSIADINNQGTVEINAAGATVFDSNFVNEPNGVIKLLGGTLAAITITQSADANFVGFGSITGDVFIDPNGLIELTGPTNILGDVEITPGARLEIRDGQTLITGHTTNNGRIHLIDGRVVFQGGYSGSGDVKKRRGRIIYAAPM